jgi:hypothetical protein
MGYGICPNCDEKVILEIEPEIGTRVICETCLADLVITWLNPIELMLSDYEDYKKFPDEPEFDSFQKIKKVNKGGKNGNGQNQKK